jgi:hypothetical protein
MYEVKIHISESGYYLYIFAQRGPFPGSWSVAKPMELEFHTITDENKEPLEPSLKLNHLEGPRILAAIKKALSEYDSDDSISLLRGRISAMENHISDLRKLLKIEEDKPIRKLRPEGDNEK